MERKNINQRTPCSLSAILSRWEMHSRYVYILSKKDCQYDRRAHRPPDSCAKLLLPSAQTLQIRQPIKLRGCTVQRLVEMLRLFASNDIIPGGRMKLNEWCKLFHCAP